jgi:hypothetical protein
VAQHSLHRLLSLLLVLGAILLLVLTWAKVVQTISSAKPPPPAARPTAIVWGDRVFQDPTSLRRWLRSRGNTYRSWRARHPNQAAILEHRPIPTAPTRAAQPHTGKVRRRTESDRRPTVGGTHGAVIRSVALTILLLLAAVLASAAALPAPFRRRFPRLADRAWPHRSAFAAAAAAILLGVAVGIGLS